MGRGIEEAGGGGECITVVATQAEAGQPTADADAITELVTKWFPTPHPAATRHAPAPTDRTGPAASRRTTRHQLSRTRAHAIAAHRPTRTDAALLCATTETR